MPEIIGLGEGMVVEELDEVAIVDVEWRTSFVNM
jgi:hypothetical protein